MDALLGGLHLAHLVARIVKGFPRMDLQYKNTVKARGLPTWKRSIGGFPLRPLAVFALAWTALPAAAAGAEAFLESFVLHPDFQIELAAMEPLVFDPVDMEFDEFGRAFVVEMPGYPFPADETGRVVILEDTDGDHVFDKRTVYAEGFPVAASILPYKGGILIVSPPDLIFLRDTDGDNKADLREVLLSGFEAGNTQHNIAGLSHALDNWIYAANGGNGGTAFWPGKPAETTPLQRNDFRFDLDAQRIELIGRSSGGFEATFDDWGRFFGTHNLRPISQIVFPGRYIEGVALSGLSNLATLPDYEENGLVRIFSIGTQVARVNHPDQSGYVSGACGITYYGGGAFPDGFEGNLFVCDVVLNLVHRAVLTEDGTVYRASRARERVEFLASTDRAFRPVNMTVGPDGALYLLDMHRDVIEHPEWIPDEIEAGLDLYAGTSQGRIYRISPKGGLPSVTPRFAREDLSGVVAHLAHPNKWWRDTAQRLLVQWKDPGATEPLLELLRTAEDPRARLHALWTLEGLDALSGAELLRFFEDEHPALREHAILLAETRPGNEALMRGIVALADDPAPRVRMQVALSLGALPGASEEIVQDAIHTIARHGLADPWLRVAMLSAAQRSPLAQFQSVLRDPAVAASAGADEFLGALAKLAGRDGDAAALEGILDTLGQARGLNSTLIEKSLDGLADGLEAARHPRADDSGRASQVLSAFVEDKDLRAGRAAWRVGNALALPLTETQRNLLARAASIALDPAVSSKQRLEQLALLEFAPYAERKTALFNLLSIEHPKEIRLAAIEQLRKVNERSVAERLVRVWNSLSPEVMRAARGILLGQRSNHDVLLTAIENEDIPLGQLNFYLGERRKLLRSPDASIRARAEALFSDAGVVTRGAAVESMRPALALEGDPVHGREAFSELCVQCHRIGQEGAALAPNLTDIFRKSRETLLFDILDPNAAVESQYVGFVIETKDGEIFSGIITDETDGTVTLRQANDLETVFYREQIREMYSSGLSLMPEGLETDMPLQFMADLLAFLLQAR